ncbi:MAG: hypothetical protein IPL92_02350 [Saprospiraceae bacterium]|nr:hypothetical protein [Candidatus Opimibacter iunctus]
MDTLLGVGAKDEDVDNTCIGQEFSSAWYKWTCDVSGTLTFTLTPNNYQPGFESDDIDFVVYELPGGIDDCANKEPRRCMAAGANVGFPFQNWVRCNGPTGLRDGDPDNTEPAGCNGAGQNNFVDALDMVAGKAMHCWSIISASPDLAFRFNGEVQGPSRDLNLLLMFLQSRPLNATRQSFLVINPLHPQIA